MPATTSQLGPLTISAPNSGAGESSRAPKKKRRAVAPAREGLQAHASFRRRYGIPPHGDRTAPDSAWGFPLPPEGHPEAKRYARAVLSRAHQAGNFRPEDVAKQVRKARRILGEPATKREGSKALTGLFPLREIASDAKGTARVIIIRAGHGNLGDRHYYDSNCLAKAVASGVFEGAQCYYDHPSRFEDQDQPGRSVKNLAGWFSDAELVNDYEDPELGKCVAIEATLHPQIGDERVLSLLRTCTAFAERYPEKSFVGLSINACGDGAPATIDGQEWNLVDTITEVVSVDLVTRAGAGGKPIAFQESYKMATATVVKIDRAKLKEQGKAALSEAKKKFLAESAIQLSPEQDAALDAALGIVDGGLLDRAIDQATGVGTDEDEEDEEDDATEDDASEDDASEDDATEDDASEDDATEDDLGEDDVTEADLAPFKGKSPDELMRIAAKSTKKAKAAEKREKRESAKAAKAAKDLREANKTLRESGSKAERQLREHRTDAVLGELKVPELYRPRLRREILEQKSLRTSPQIREYAKEFVSTFVRTSDGGGQTFREGFADGGASEIKLTFSPAAPYAG